MNELNEYTENCFNFNGIEEYEENDTAVAECDEVIFHFNNIIIFN